jgi:transcriptional regulator with XRE-family HTH domain
MVAMTDRFYSTMRMRYVGRVLSDWRGRSGLTGDVVAERLNWARSKISKLENASQTITAADVISMAVVYAVSEAERDELVEEVEHATERGWWLSYGDAVTAKQFDRYVDFETEAVSLVNFEIDLIPGLLQTEDYVRAIARAFTPSANTAEIQHRVEVRKRRQARLFADHPIEFDAVVNEAALHQLVGGKDVMSTQLKHLARIAHLPNVSIRMVPFSVGAYPAMGRPFVILRFDRPEWPDVAYQENLNSCMYIEHPAEVEQYNGGYAGLCERALSKDETLRAIDTLAGTL